jgi:hypothetical protein
MSSGTVQVKVPVKAVTVSATKFGMGDDLESRLARMLVELENGFHAQQNGDQDTVAVAAAVIRRKRILHA